MHLRQTQELLLGKNAAELAATGTSDSESNEDEGDVHVFQASTDLQLDHTQETSPDVTQRPEAEQGPPGQADDLEYQTWVEQASYRNEGARRTSGQKAAGGKKRSSRGLTPQEAPSPVQQGRGGSSQNLSRSPSVGGGREASIGGGREGEADEGQTRRRRGKSLAGFGGAAKDDDARYANISWGTGKEMHARRQADSGQLWI